MLSDAMMCDTATSGDHTARVSLRRFEDDADLEACVALQELVWGEDFGAVTPPALLKVVDEVAGVAAGAFDAVSERLEGFVFGISGLRDGQPAHWSHMLAVRPCARGRGLGLRLKAFQRRLLLEEGIAKAFWTFDPLVARNAHLNLARLGALPDGYRRDYYGSGEDSALSAGLGTDRFVVRWDLSSERVERTLAGGSALDEETLRRAERAPIVNVRPSADDARGPEHVEPVVLPTPDRPPWPPDLPLVRVEIPEDIQAVRDADIGRAIAWRRSTRRAIEACLERGYRAEGFCRTPDHRCHYLFIRSAP